jgi:XTP/dITP diphosphohydrolase
LRTMRELGWVPIALDGAYADRVAVAAFHRPFVDSRYFVTGNPTKLLELRHAAEIEHLHGCDFDLPELKDDDIARIAEHKARQAYEIVRRPVVSTDGGIFLSAYGGFPGPNSKQAATLLKPVGLLKLLDGINDRGAVRRNTVACFDGTTMQSSTSQVPLTIAPEARGTYPSYPMDKILVPVHDANRNGLTYAEIPVEERARFTELPALAEFVRTCAD